MAFGWKILFPLALLNVLVTAVVLCIGRRLSNVTRCCEVC